MYAKLKHSLDGSISLDLEMVTRDSMCVIARLIAMSLFEIAHVSIRAKSGWVVVVVEWVWRPSLENFLSIISNGWHGLGGLCLDWRYHCGN